MLELYLWVSFVTACVGTATIGVVLALSYRKPK